MSSLPRHIETNANSLIFMPSLVYIMNIWKRFKLKFSLNFCPDIPNSILKGGFIGTISNCRMLLLYIYVKCSEYRNRRQANKTLL